MGIQTKLDEAPEEAPDFWVGVEVRDEAHPGLVARFEFKPLGEGPGSELVMTELTIRSDDPTIPLLAPSALRDLPMARWANAARARATAGDQTTGAEELEARYPTGDPTMDAALRLGIVARRYRQAMLEGVPNPAARVAEDMGANPGTVRSWIRRARQAGLLGPARGPTPGEASQPEDIEVISEPTGPGPKDIIEKLKQDEESTTRQGRKR